MVRFQRCVTGGYCRTIIFNIVKSSKMTKCFDMCNRVMLQCLSINAPLSFVGVPHPSSNVASLSEILVVPFKLHYCWC